ncbi:Ankyrin repeat-containing protein [Abeliophyllum distichum]|uniref:Ankyrin repeat-containing protein n=1 Tax=Abeliophyllum distichum TaxID=126358 RepID=A0ABD1SG37_9LAMI
MKFGSLLDDEKEEELENEKTMQKKLHEAAINGEIPILLQLIQENPQILTSKFSSIPNNPLHTAVLLGNSFTDVGLRSPWVWKKKSWRRRERTGDGSDLERRRR